MTTGNWHFVMWVGPLAIGTYIIAINGYTIVGTSLFSNCKEKKIQKTKWWNFSSKCKMCLMVAIARFTRKFLKHDAGMNNILLKTIPCWYLPKCIVNILMQFINLVIYCIECCRSINKWWEVIEFLFEHKNSNDK